MLFDGLMRAAMGVSNGKADSTARFTGVRDFGNGDSRRLYVFANWKACQTQIATAFIPHTGSPRRYPQEKWLHSVES